MLPCGKSAEYCLAPVTSLLITPTLLKNAGQTAELMCGMWPTTATSCNMATAQASLGLNLSLSQRKTVPIGTAHIF